MSISSPPQAQATIADERSLSSARSVGGWIALAVVVGFALRIWEATEASLWLDELHTLSHASEPTIPAVIDHVAREVHSPLFFVFVHLFGGWKEGAWLRAIPIVSSMLVLFPLLALSRDTAGGARSKALIAWLYVCLPYQVHYGAMLRPYAWVALFTALAVCIAFSEHGPKPLRFVLFLLCVLLGLATHRIMVLSVVSIGVARLLVRGPKLLELRWLVLAGALAVLPSLPWLLGFAQQATQQRFEYQEQVGGYHLRPALVREFLASPLRLFVPFIGALEGGWARLCKVASVSFFALGGGAAFGWVVKRARGAMPASGPFVSGVIMFAAVDFALISAFSIYSWDRLPLQYFSTLAWVLPIALAEVLGAAPGSERSKRTLAILLGASALLLGIAQAGGRSTEDMRHAVQRAREIGAAIEAKEGRAPIYTAILSQPSAFEDVIPYRAYAPDLAVTALEALPVSGDPEFARSLVVLQRAIPLERPEWAPIKSGRTLVSQERIDSYLSVCVFRTTSP